MDLDDLAADLAKEIAERGQGMKDETGRFIATFSNANPSEKIVRLAVYRSVYEMMWTSGLANFNEEHQTASLMGHLTSNFAWYTRLAASDDDGEVDDLPEILWASQAHHEEAKTGSDFAIISNISNDDKNINVRIVLFQAKKSYSKNDGNEDFSISHVTGQPKDIDLSQEMKLLLSAGQEELARDLSPQVMREVEEIIAIDAPKPRYQLESLLRSHFLGRSLETSRNQWCFYVIWHKAVQGFVKEPTVFSAGSISASLFEKNDWKTPGRHKITADYSFFSDLISSSISNPKYDCGITVPIGSINQFMVNVCKILPKLNIAVASKSRGGNRHIVRALSSKFLFSHLGAFAPAHIPAQSSNPRP